MAAGIDARVLIAALDANDEPEYLHTTDLGGASGGTGGSGGLTDAELRASPIATSGGLTNTELRATPVPVSGTLTVNEPVTIDGIVAVSNFPATQPVSGPLTDAQLRATPVPVSGTMSVNEPVTVDGPLTDAELRASAVPVSGPVTDAQLRATAVPVSGPLTDAQLRATAVPISGALTDAQLRATAVPVSGPLTDAQLRATSVPVTAGGNVAHDAVDSGNPQKIGYKAIAHGANPTAVAAGDRTDAYANRHGIPWVIGGHPNIFTARSTFSAAQTDTAIVTISAGQKLVITRISALADHANSVDVAVRVGFGAANTPTGNGVVLSHPGIAPGSGDVEGSGAGMLGIGADGEDLRVTSEVPTGGTIELVYTYYIIES